MESGLVKQTPDTNAPPTLDAIEPTGTIECRLFLIMNRHQLVIGEVAGRGDGAAKGEPPGLCIQGAGRIGDPACGGKRDCSVADHLARAGEAPPGARQSQDTLGELLSWPERRNGPQQATV